MNVSQRLVSASCAGQTVQTATFEPMQFAQFTGAAEELQARMKKKTIESLPNRRDSNVSKLSDDCSNSSNSRV